MTTRRSIGKSNGIIFSFDNNKAILFVYKFEVMYRRHRNRRRGNSSRENNCFQGNNQWAEWNYQNRVPYYVPPPNNALVSPFSCQLENPIDAVGIPTIGNDLVPYYVPCPPIPPKSCQLENPIDAVGIPTIHNDVAPYYVPPNETSVEPKSCQLENPMDTSKMDRFTPHPDSPRYMRISQKVCRAKRDISGVEEEVIVEHLVEIYRGSIHGGKSYKQVYISKDLTTMVSFFLS